MGAHLFDAYHVVDHPAVVGIRTTATGLARIIMHGLLDRKRTQMPHGARSSAIAEISAVLPASDVRVAGPVIPDCDVLTFHGRVVRVVTYAATAEEKLKLGVGAQCLQPAERSLNQMVSTARPSGEWGMTQPLRHDLNRHHRPWWLIP